MLYYRAQIPQRISLYSHRWVYLAVEVEGNEEGIDSTGYWCGSMRKQCSKCMRVCFSIEPCQYHVPLLSRSYIPWRSLLSSVPRYYLFSVSLWFYFSLKAIFVSLYVLLLMKQNVPFWVKMNIQGPEHNLGGWWMILKHMDYGICSWRGIVCLQLLSHDALTISLLCFSTLDESNSSSLITHFLFTYPYICVLYFTLYYLFTVHVAVIKED